MFKIHETVCKGKPTCSISNIGFSLRPVLYNLKFTCGCGWSFNKKMDVLNEHIMASLHMERKGMEEAI